MKKQKNSVLYNGDSVAIKRFSAVKRRIVIIDDDPGIRDIFGIIFEREGYIIELKSNGEGILDNSLVLPDLFFIDKQLSGFNGLDLCRSLKRRVATSHIPVIMISASPDIATLSKEAGADDYLEKPFDISYLLKMAERYSRKNEIVFSAGNTSPW